MFTDSGFLYGTFKTINYLIQHGVTVYQYILTYEGEHSFSEVYSVPPTGVCHADDLLYLWNPWLLGWRINQPNIIQLIIWTIQPK